MIYLTETFSYWRLRWLAEKIDGFTVSWASAESARSLLEPMKWINDEIIRPEWQSAIRKPETAMLLSLILNKKIEPSDRPIKLERGVTLICLAPMGEQGGLLDVYLDLHKRIKYATFNIFDIWSTITPEEEKIVLHEVERELSFDLEGIVI